MLDILSYRITGQGVFATHSILLCAFGLSIVASLAHSCMVSISKAVYSKDSPSNGDGGMLV